MEHDLNILMISGIKEKLYFWPVYVMKRESWGSSCKALLEGVVMKQALVGTQQTDIDEARQRVILEQA